MFHENFPHQEQQKWQGLELNVTVYLIHGKFRSTTIDEANQFGGGGGGGGETEKTRLFGGQSVYGDGASEGGGGGETEKTARRRSESFEYNRINHLQNFSNNIFSIFLPFYALIVCVQRVEEERRRACLDQVLPRHQCPRCQRCDGTGSV